MTMTRTAILWCDACDRSHNVPGDIAQVRRDAAAHGWTRHLLRDLCPACTSCPRRRGQTHRHQTIRRPRSAVRA